MSKQPQVGWWTTLCCEEDLQQIANEDDLREYLRERDESIEDEGFSRRKFWPAREAALRDLK